MLRCALSLIVLIAALLSGALPLAAQSGDSLPPTIISFGSDVPSLTLAEAEAGTRLATFTWQAVGVRPEHRVTLEAYRLTAWETVLPAEATSLPAIGNFTLAIAHPVNFGPPTYRLVIVDAVGRALDQRVLVIPYDQSGTVGAPQIDSFTTPLDPARGDVIDTTQLAARTARVSVTWQVSNRQPDTNLVFEQVLEGGRVVSVELPRPNVWVPSSGSGIVAPVAPGAGLPVRLRLRVVSMVDGTTLAEAALPPLNTGTLPPVPAQPEPPVAPIAAPPPEIVVFTAAPENIPRGGTLTLTWEVRNATSIGVWLLGPDGRLSQQAPSSASQGTWTVTVPEVYVDHAVFMIFVTNADGVQTDASLIIDVICPYAYFFAPAGADLPCPRTGALTVQGAFQRFEHGIMLWRADSSEIYVLYDNGLLNRYRDSWLGEPIYFTPEPPYGLYRPDRGFGKVWVENPQVRTALGWATMFEQGYTMRVQQSGDFRYPRLYIELPDKSVVYLVENVWRRLGE